MSLAAEAILGTGASDSDIAIVPPPPPYYKFIGMTLAISSGVFIGASFVLKKKGLLRSSAVAGEGHEYLRSPLWWTGMVMMIIGEICNFVAYSFAPALIVTPLGALSVVVWYEVTIHPSYIEKLNLNGKIGCALCLVGAVVIVLHAPAQAAVTDIGEFKQFVIQPGFLVYMCLVIAISLFLIWKVAPKYGKKHMLVYITVCSLIGSLSVVATQGLGAAIVLNITTGTPQFNHWFIYVTIVFVLCTLLTEINYLNKALNLFNTAVVTPVYYVFFTSATLIASVILFQGFSASPVSILTVVMGFFVICAGVVLLQTSKSAVLAEFALKKSKSFTEFVTVSSALSFTDHHHHHQHFSTDDGILSGSGDARDIHKDETDGLDPGPLGLRAVPFDAIRQMVRASTMPSSPASFVEKENHRLFGKKRRRRSTRGELDLDLGPDSHDDHGFSTSRVLSNSALDEMAASGDSEKMLERDYVERTRSFRLEERVLDPPVNIPEGDQQHWNHSDVEHPDLVDTEDILSDQEHGPSGNGSSEKRTDKGMSP